ncbi:MAG: hypothetical protein SGILL_002937, partial [Bacillariaceae sp.]
MTRGLVPPNTLSDQDVHTLRVVRRDMYTNGVIGGGLGACAGFVTYTGALYAKKFGYLQKVIVNRNHGMMMTLASFALGTFLAASKTGIEEVHTLHPVFRAGAVDVDPSQLQQQQQPQYDTNSYEGRRKALLENRLARRKTMDNRLHNQNGLSDSHAGRWVEDDETIHKREIQDNRMARRRTLDNLIKKGHGLSDSHAGRWVAATATHHDDTTRFEKE